MLEFEIGDLRQINHRGFPDRGNCLGCSQLRCLEEVYEHGSALGKFGMLSFMYEGNLYLAN